MNLRVSFLNNNMKIVNEFVQKIRFDANKIVEVPILPKLKKRYRICNKNCKKKVK